MEDQILALQLRKMSMLFVEKNTYFGKGSRSSIFLEVKYCGKKSGETPAKVGSNHGSSLISSALRLLEFQI